jgi:hypothetical protein
MKLSEALYGNGVNFLLYNNQEQKQAFIELLQSNYGGIPISNILSDNINEIVFIDYDVITLSIYEEKIAVNKLKATWKTVIILLWNKPNVSISGSLSFMSDFVAGFDIVGQLVNMRDRTRPTGMILELN